MSASSSARPAAAASGAAPRVHAAGMVRRAIAGGIDLVVLVTLFVLLQAASSLVIGRAMPRLAQLGPAGLVDAVLSGSALAATGLLLFVLLCMLYGTLLDAGAGQTLGKRVVGIRVIDGFGQPLGIGRSALRSVAMLPSVAIAGLGLLWIGFDRERRGLHDHLSDTHVIVIRRSDAIRDTRISDELDHEPRATAS